MPNSIENNIRRAAQERVNTVHFVQTKVFEASRPSDCIEGV